jgi:dipeptidyl aminopeptidase/acylaminoacyl peptidase
MYPQTDSNRIGMTGLSGGGWQTIMLSSLDTRIAAAAPNAGYIGLVSRADYPADRGDLEQNPSDLLTIADYSHLTAMLAPRPALLIYNESDDCCFSSARAWPSVYKPVIPFYQL